MRSFKVEPWPKGFLCALEEGDKLDIFLPENLITAITENGELVWKPEFIKKELIYTRYHNDEDFDEEEDFIMIERIGDYKMTKILTFVESNRGRSASSYYEIIRRSGVEVTFTAWKTFFDCIDIVEEEEKEKDMRWNYEKIIELRKR